MKPSEFVSVMRERIAADVMFTPSFELLSSTGQAHASITAVVHYLDEEAERRGKFEADVLKRLGKLEALNPEARDVVGSTPSGCTVRGLVAPVGVYEGDGHPDAREGTK